MHLERNQLADRNCIAYNGRSELGIPDTYGSEQRRPEALAICLMRLVHVTLTRDARSSFPIVALKSCPFGAHSLVLNSHSATEDGAFGFTDVPRI